MAKEEFRAGAHGFRCGPWPWWPGYCCLPHRQARRDRPSARPWRHARKMPSPPSAIGWIRCSGRRPTRHKLPPIKPSTSRILMTSPAGQVSDDDTLRLARLVSEDSGISMSAAMNRVTDAEARYSQSVNNARKATAIAALWTAFSLLFGAIVAVAAAIAARWQDDRISFSRYSGARISPGPKRTRSGRRQSRPRRPGW